MRSASLLEAPKLESEGAEPVAMQSNRHLFTLLLTIAIWLHSIKLHVCMLWLTFIMRKPAVARRTIAIELLRRTDQLDNYRRRSSSTPTHRPCYKAAVHRSPQCATRKNQSYDCWASACTTKNISRQHKQAACGTAFTSLCLASRTAVGSPGDNVSALSEANGSRISTQKESVIGCTPLLVVRCALADVSPQGQQHLDRPRSRTKRRRREQVAVAEVQTTPLSSPSRKSTQPGSRSADLRKSSQQAGGGRRIITPRTNSVNKLRDVHLRSRSGVLSCNAPPLGRYPLPSLRSDSVAISVQDDAVGGAEERIVADPNRTQLSTEDVFNELCETTIDNHLRSNSVGSGTTVLRRATAVTLRSHSKSNGGLLELKASTARPRESTPTRIHRRNISLNIPIRSAIPKLETFPEVRKRWSTCTTTTTQPYSDEPTTPTQLESELQYKHRHIFVGTASLHAFLAILETSSLGFVTKHAIMKAYTLLASKEQLLARQRSVNHEDWHLVSRITPDVLEFDYITLARVQLGSVSLQHFVDSIPFDGSGEAPLGVVVEAFKNASHMDAQEERETGGKKCAFKRWLLSHGGLGE